jgi:hypothetical protein
MFNEQNIYPEYKYKITIKSGSYNLVNTSADHVFICNPQNYFKFAQTKPIVNIDTALDTLIFFFYKKMKKAKNEPNLKRRPNDLPIYIRSAEQATFGKLTKTMGSIHSLKATGFYDKYNILGINRFKHFSSKYYYEFYREMLALEFAEYLLSKQSYDLAKKIIMHVVSEESYYYKDNLDEIKDSSDKKICLIKWNEKNLPDIKDKNTSGCNGLFRIIARKILWLMYNLYNESGNEEKAKIFLQAFDKKCESEKDELDNKIDKSNIIPTIIPTI